MYLTRKVDRSPKKEIGMNYLEELFAVGLKFHGHKCPAMPLGMRAGLAAMKTLEVEHAPNKELFCFCETGTAHATMCFVDGVQLATGCTYGKSNIKKLAYDKNALTLIHVKTRRAVRVSIRPEFQINGLKSEFVTLRSRGIAPQDVPPEIVDPLVQKILTLKDEDMLVIGQVHTVDFTPAKGTFEWRRCEACGEVVFAHGLRLVKDRLLCIPCSGYSTSS